MLNTTTIKLINIFCLLVAIVVVLLLPAKKEIWYDETVSMMCSKGISADDPARMAGKSVITSTELEKLNTVPNVFDATVTDNANSFLYNFALHRFTDVCGNSINAYMMFSKLYGIAVLVAFYVLSSLFFGNSLYRPLAIILLATDIDFSGMSHEIRAYIMCMFFVTMAGVNFFRYLNRGQSPVNLFFIAFFSVGAVLCHFLSVYIILTICVALLLIYRQRLFTLRNMLSIAVPIAIIATFFYLAYPGLSIMSRQNTRIQARNVGEVFSVWVVVSGTLKFIALNFKAVFPAFINKLPVILLSFFAVMALYIAALKSAADTTVKRNLHLLFALGVSSSVFLAILCLKSGHYTALYYRYHTFSIPFSTLFAVYALYVIMQNEAVAKLLKAGTLATILLPTSLLFVMGVRTAKAEVKYNHVAVANLIMKDKITRVELPTWNDAFLIQCVLPSDYKIDYVRNEFAPYFTLHSSTGDQKIPVHANNN